MHPAALSSPLSRAAAVLFVVTAALVLWFCLTPAIALLPGGGHIDKVEHFGAYLLLTGLGFAALQRRSGRLVAGVILFGLGVEGLQAWLPIGRSAEVWDALANTGGAGAAWLGWSGLERRGR